MSNETVTYRIKLKKRIVTLAEEFFKASQTMDKTGFFRVSSLFVEIDDLLCRYEDALEAERVSYSAALRGQLSEDN